MVDVHRQKNGVTFGSQVLVKIDKFFNGDEVAVFGEYGEEEGEETLFEDEGEAELVVEFVGFCGDE